MRLLKYSGRQKRAKRPFIFRRVEGYSMYPALKPGALVVGSCLLRRIKPGDLIIFYNQGREKIKRVSALRSGELYLLGDNHEASSDSREFGWVDKGAVIAKVIWPKK